ncbi:hypothetical protein [Collimonas humicola]|uniref:hypothetical protein n=1 Tax=Collimonas humicola TaxID=2825886 RepID=UPI001B8BDBB6|nr:hypothetical protein [Collimonas humicola]
MASRLPLAGTSKAISRIVPIAASIGQTPRLKRCAPAANSAVAAGALYLQLHARLRWVVNGADYCVP